MPKRSTMQFLLASSETRNTERSVATKTCSRAVLVRVRLLAFLMLSVSVIGCKDGATTWSAEVRSPDAQWVATARTQSWSGPGTAYDATTVYLAQRSGSPTAVLGFSHQFQTMKLVMTWPMPRHLDVAYGPSERPGDSVKVDLETVRFGDVDITLHQLSTGSPR